MKGSPVKFLLFNMHFSESEQPVKYKIVFLNSVFLLAGIVAFGLAFIRMQTSLALGVIDFVFALLNFALLAYLNRHKEKIELVSSIALSLSFLLFSAIYLLAPANPTRVSLFFLLAASAFFLKGRSVGRLWLVFIIASILAGQFIPIFETGYSPFDTLTTCIYLVALFFIFENYETFKEGQYQLGQEQERLRRSEELTRKLNTELEAKVQERTQQLLAAQDELVRKEKLAVLGQVAGTVGHELRNPLGVMSNAVYFLQTVLADVDDTTKEYLAIIQGEISGSERIVSDLLDSVRIQPPHPESVGVRQIIEQTVGKLTIPSNVRITLDMPETLPMLWVDVQQMQQVFRNLVSNGIEAMPDGGTLEIVATADEAAKYVTIGVRDSGIGIAPEQLDKLFQPLYTTKERGIGLGLVVVKNLTEANGGMVDVQSEPGKGSTFSITLPCKNSAG